MNKPLESFDFRETDSVILDIDGTLWDSTEIVAKAWIKAFEKSKIHDYEISADILKGLFGKKMDEIAYALMPDQSKEKRDQVSDYCYIYEDEELHNDPCDIFYPDVIDTIREMSERIPFFIVSNCQKGYIETVIEKANIHDCIKDFESYGNTGMGKDHNLRLVVERNNLKAPVYVGDTEGDRIACAEAGIPFIWASYGFGNPEKYDKKIESFGELRQILS